MTLLGVGVSYLFSRRIFSPIYNLTQLLYPNTPRSSLPRRDELHLISARMKEIQQKNQAFQENLQTILPSVKQYHLRELLTARTTFLTRKTGIFWKTASFFLWIAPFSSAGLRPLPQGFSGTALP